MLRHVSTLQSPSLRLQTRVKVVYKPRVYYWGGGVSVPTTLPLLPDSQMVDVSAGRMQWAGVTENGKLVFWEVRCRCVRVRPGFILPISSFFQCAQSSSGPLGTTRLTMTQTAGVRKKEPAAFIPRIVGAGGSVLIKKVACGDAFSAVLTR